MKANPIPQMTQTDIDRFWIKVDKTSSDKGCWEWTGAQNGVGYGHMKIQGSDYLAHRISYYLKYGNPDDLTLEVDHICKNTLCVRIDHLQLIPKSENIHLQHHPSGKEHWKGKRTTCPNGHEYDYVDPSGHRRCQKCKNEKRRMGLQNGGNHPNQNTNRTHCLKGHKFDYIDPKTGSRQCNTCKSERTRISRAKKKKNKK